MNWGPRPLGNFDSWRAMLLRRASFLGPFGLLIALSLSLWPVGPVLSVERQRIASQADTSHALDGEVTASYLAAGQMLFLAVTANCAYEYQNLWRLDLSLPLMMISDASKPSPLIGIGDVSLASQWCFCQDDLRWRLGAAWSFPCAEANRYHLTKVYPNIGSDAHQFELRCGVSLIRDPVVLTAGLNTVLPLPAITSNGQSWQGAQAAVNLGFHEVLNEAVSWSIAISPSLEFPAWRNGHWLSTGLSWSSAINLSVGWHTNDRRLTTGLRYVGNGLWALTGSLGGTKTW